MSAILSFIVSLWNAWLAKRQAQATALGKAQEDSDMMGRIIRVKDREQQAAANAPENRKQAEQVLKDHEL
jgi:hypothetical protein